MCMYVCICVYGNALVCAFVLIQEKRRDNEDAGAVVVISDSSTCQFQVIKQK